MPDTPALIADIGATHARFALSDHRDFYAESVFYCADYPAIADAIRAYISDCTDFLAPDHGAIAIACPVLGDEVAMTNHPWHFSITHLKHDLNFRALHVVNDFAATAMAVPVMDPACIRSITDDSVKPQPDAPIGIIGPGTGLGVVTLVPTSDNYIPMPGEGGHVSVPAHTQREFDILQTLYSQGHDHVSAERVCSGPGLENIYSALCCMEGRNDLPARRAEAISEAALNGDCAIARQALDHLFIWLGRVAGDLALTIGAHGGIYIGGGIGTRLGDALVASDFHSAFCAKGRFDDYLQQIPCAIINHPCSAFVGLNQLLQRDM